MKSLGGLHAATAKGMHSPNAGKRLQLSTGRENDEPEIDQGRYWQAVPPPVPALVRAPPPATAFRPPPRREPGHRRCQFALARVRAADRAPRVQCLARGDPPSFQLA